MLVLLWFCIKLFYFPYYFVFYFGFVTMNIVLFYFIGYCFYFRLHLLHIVCMLVCVLFAKLQNIGHSMFLVLLIHVLVSFLCCQRGRRKGIQPQQKYAISQGEDNWMICKTIHICGLCHHQKGGVCEGKSERTEF